MLAKKKKRRKRRRKVFLSLFFFCCCHFSTSNQTCSNSRLARKRKEGRDKTSFLHLLVTTPRKEKMIGLECLPPTSILTGFRYYFWPHICTDAFLDLSLSLSDAKRKSGEERKGKKLSAFPLLFLRPGRISEDQGRSSFSSSQSFFFAFCGKLDSKSAKASEDDPVIVIQVLDNSQSSRKLCVEASCCRPHYIMWSSSFWRGQERIGILLKLVTL